MRGALTWLAAILGALILFVGILAIAYPDSPYRAMVNRVFPAEQPIPASSLLAFAIQLETRFPVDVIRASSLEESNTAVFTVVQYGDLTPDMLEDMRDLLQSTFVDRDAYILINQPFMVYGIACVEDECAASYLGPGNDAGAPAVALSGGLEHYPLLGISD